MDRVFSSSIYGPSAKSAGYKSKGKKRGSVTTYSTDRENEVSKIFTSSVCLRGSGTILIHTEWLQISHLKAKRVKCNLKSFLSRQHALIHNLK